MNLQIVSNTYGVVNKNKTNKFEMKLEDSINALDNNVYVEVLSVCYPSTTKNVLENTCFIELQMEIDNFMKYRRYNSNGLLASELEVENNNYDINRNVTLFGNIYGENYSQFPLTYSKNKLKVETSRVNIPEGIYNLERLIEYINNVYEQYNVFLSIEKNGKIKINANLLVEYWIFQKEPTYVMGEAHDAGVLNKFRLSNSSTFMKKGVYSKNFNYTVTLKMSEKLAFMLGFDDLNQVMKMKDTPTVSVYADYLPDVSDGLNKMYIYCDEIERTLVGDVTAELLTTVPIQWSGQGGGDGELICFSPPLLKKKFKRADIKSLHISLRDTKGDLIPFDSGTVTIDCRVVR